MELSSLDLLQPVSKGHYTVFAFNSRPVLTGRYTDFAFNLRPVETGRYTLLLLSCDLSQRVAIQYLLKNGLYHLPSIYGSLHDGSNVNYDSTKVN